MLTILLCVILGAIIGIVIELGYDSNEYAFSAFICGAAGSCIGFIVAIVIGAIYYSPPVLKEMKQLASLERGDTKENGAWLISTRFNGEVAYVFKSTKNGQERVEVITAGDRVAISQENRPDGLLNKYLANQGCGLWGICGERWRYEFHIPKGAFKADHLQPDEVKHQGDGQ